MAPERDPRFDRVGAAGAGRQRARDDAGKEALYSMAPGSPPAAHVALACERCRAQRDLMIADLVAVLRPPVVWNPLRRRASLWARCPACGQRSWLRLGAGAAVRSLLSGRRRPA